jgi:hypothetical protein
MAAAAPPNNIASLDAYLNAMIGIASADVRAALYDQGLLIMDSFVNLTDKDVDQMCTNVRKPGSTINNPPVARVPVMIPNPGLPIGHIQVVRLKMLLYYVVHFTQREFVVADATLDRLADVYRLKEVEDTATTVVYPEKLTDITRVCHTLENIDAYLRQQLGCNGVPLPSVCHASVAVLAEADDELFGMPT